jgi:phospholipid/cholesterol/gamma-HCH transport system substrate-binding protein
MSVLERTPGAAGAGAHAAPAPERRHRREKTRRRLAGVAFLAVLALLAWLSVAVYNQQFTQVALVTLHVDSTGNEMHLGASVMVRGVQVGEVRSITANGQGATLVLALQPSQLGYIPANVTAEMLPTTLFGERYVDLITPRSPSAARLTAGDVIGQDRSADAIEVQQVLNNLLPMLQSLQPEQLSVSLTAIAQGLSGHGAELGQSLVRLDSYLRRTNPNLAALDADIRGLASLARVYNGAAPDLLQALDDFTVTSHTIATQSANLSALYTTLTTASDDLRSFLAANSSNMIHLAVNSVGTLQILARYAPEFPCTLRDLVQFEPAINKVLGAGTNQPGLHANVIVTPVYANARYLAGVNTPVYNDNLGPHCYPIPFTGISLNDGAGGGAGTTAALQGLTGGGGSRGTAASRGTRPVQQPAATLDAAGATALGPSGLAGSPAEIELVRELAALQLGSSPSAVPGWSDLLLGPLLRGSEVRLTAVRR